MDKYNKFMQSFLRESTGFMGEELAMLFLEQHGGAEAFNVDPVEAGEKMILGVHGWTEKQAMDFYKIHGKKCVDYMEEMVSEEGYDRIEDMIADWNGLNVENATPEQVRAGLDDDTTDVGQKVALAVTLATSNELLRYWKDHCDHKDKVMKTEARLKYQGLGILNMNLINHILDNKNESNLFIVNISEVATEKAEQLMKLAVIKDNKFWDVTQLVADIISEDTVNDGIKVIDGDSNTVSGRLLHFMSTITGNKKTDCEHLNSIYYHTRF